MRAWITGGSGFVGTYLVDAFGLDGDLLDFGPAPEQPWLVPFDTRLDATATAATLGVELPDLDEQLRRLEQIERPDAARSDQSAGLDAPRR